VFSLVETKFFAHLGWRRSTKLVKYVKIALALGLMCHARLPLIDYEWAYLFQ
jgi:hypothetical protein